MSKDQIKATEQVTQVTQEKQDQPLDSTKPKIITCFIYYNSDEELTKIFKAINDFRENNNLKYSHHAGYVFFNILADLLGEFKKLSPFSISKYQTLSEYNCSKDIGDKIMEKKNSFIKMRWNPSENTTNSGFVSFISRTIGKVHHTLVRKIFRENEIEFDRTNYKYTKNSDSENGESVIKENKKKDTESVDSGFVKVERKSKSSKTVEQKDKSKYNKKKSATDSVPKIRGRNTK